MAAQTTKSTLAAKLGDRGKRAHVAHRSDDINWGFSELPAGIIGGIAQLSSITHGTYGPNTQNPNQPYVRLEGRALEPREHDGVKVEGKPVSMTLALCDTPGKKLRNGLDGTFENRYADFLTELKKLSDQEMILRIEESDLQEIDEIIEELVAVSPFFNFSTRGWTPKPTKDDPKPAQRVSVNFDGRCDYGGGSDDPGFMMQDSTEAGESFDDGAKPASNGSNQTTAKAGERITQKVMDEVYHDEHDEADAETGGHGDPEIDDGASASSEMIPEKGDVFNYRPIHPATKKKAARPVEVMVDSIVVKSRTATVHDTDSKKVYKDVSWDDLEPLT